MEGARRAMEGARRAMEGEKVPYLFALNSVAGSFAVILALYLGVKFGYQSAIVASVLLFCLAGRMVNQRQVAQVDRV